MSTQAEAESDFEQLGTLVRHSDLHDRFSAGWRHLAGAGDVSKGGIGG